MIQEPVEHSRGELLLEDPMTTDSSCLPPSRQPAWAKSKKWRKFQRRAKVAARMRFTGFSSLTGSMGGTFVWSAQVNLTGSAYNPSTNSSSINKRQALGTQASNAQSGGCDECFSFQQGIVAGGTATINLNAMTDLLQRAAVTLARIKGYQMRVLSDTDDPTISPRPTATSVGLVTNNVATPALLDFSAGGSGLALNLTVSGGALSAVAIGTAGSGYMPSASFIVAPVQSTGSGAVVSVTTNSGGVPTAVAAVANGGNYTNANNVASVSLGQHIIYTGGWHSYADPSANGFTTISATQKNVLLVNLDQTNAITFEIDVFGATT